MAQYPVTCRQLLQLDTPALSWYVLPFFLRRAVLWSRVVIYLTSKACQQQEEVEIKWMIRWYVKDENLFDLWYTNSKQRTCKHEWVNESVSRAGAGGSNLQDRGGPFWWTCAGRKKEKGGWGGNHIHPRDGRTHTHTHLPCVSVDWVNQPNFPFFFSVRSASVTPWCYQHAVHTARQQRKQWVSTRQRERRGGERNERRETAAIQTTVQTQLPCPEKLQNKCAGHRVQSSWHKKNLSLDYVVLLQQKKIIQHIHF